MVKQSALAVVLGLLAASAMAGRPPAAARAGGPAVDWHNPGSFAAQPLVDRLEFGDEVELPDDIALIIETGCTQCNGPSTGLVRAYRDPKRATRVDVLLSLPEGADDAPYVTGITVGDQAAVMVAGVCTRGRCGALGTVSSNAQTTLYRTTDGGVTWQTLDVLDGGNAPVVLTEGGLIILGPDPEDSTGRVALFRLPGGERIEPPAEADADWLLAMPADGDVLWWSRDHREVIRTSGPPYLRPALPASALLFGVAPDPERGRFAVSWSIPDPTAAHPQFALSIVAPDGSVTTTVATPGPLTVAGWLDESTAIAMSCPTSACHTPALIDLRAGVIHPLAGLPDAPDIRAVLRGPFARVVGMDGCLALHAAPDAAADTLECLAAGVLTRLTGETQVDGGTTWVRVVAPSGVPGWADAAMLER